MTQKGYLEGDVYAEVVFSVMEGGHEDGVLYFIAEHGIITWTFWSPHDIRNGSIEDFPTGNGWPYPNQAQMSLLRAALLLQNRT